MEELKSTEALDREILEDAREKALKIVLSTEETIKAHNLNWDKKLESALDSARKGYDERSLKIEGEIFARLPLDQKRRRSEAAENILLKAMDDFLRSLPRDKLLLILEKELLGRLKSWAGGGMEIIKENVSVRYSNMDSSEAELILRKIPDSGNWEIKKDSVFHEFPSITINTPSMKINASVETAAAAILKAKRAELASALLSDGVLND